MGTPENSSIGEAKEVGEVTKEEITALLKFLEDNAPDLMGMTELRGILIAQEPSGKRWLAFLSKRGSMSIDFKDDFEGAAPVIEEKYSNIFCCHIPEEEEESFREKWQHSGATIKRIFTQETKPAPSE